MKKLLLAAILTAGLTLAARAADVDPGITKTMADFSAAWAKNDVNGMTAIWAEDGDLINPAGRAGKGHDEIAKIFTDEHAVMFKASTFSCAATGSRSLGKGVEWVDFDYTIKNATPDGAPATDLHGHLVILFKEAGKDWKVVSARPYMFAPMGPPPAK